MVFAPVVRRIAPLYRHPKVRFSSNLLEVWKVSHQDLFEPRQ